MRVCPTGRKPVDQNKEYMYEVPGSFVRHLPESLHVKYPGHDKDSPTADSPITVPISPIGRATVRPTLFRAISPIDVFFLSFFLRSRTRAQDVE